MSKLLNILIALLAVILIPTGIILYRVNEPSTQLIIGVGIALCISCVLAFVYIIALIYHALN